MTTKMKKTRIYHTYSYLSSFSASSTQKAFLPLGLSSKKSKYPCGYYHKSKYYKRGYYKHLLEYYPYHIVHSSIILNNRGQNKIKIVPVMFHEKPTPTLKTIRRRFMKAMGYRKR